MLTPPRGHLKIKLNEPGVREFYEIHKACVLLKGLSHEINVWYFGLIE